MGGGQFSKNVGFRDVLKRVRLHFVFPGKSELLIAVNNLFTFYGRADHLKLLIRLNRAGSVFWDQDGISLVHKR